MEISLSQNPTTGEKKFFAKGKDEDFICRECGKEIKEFGFRCSNLKAEEIWENGIKSIKRWHDVFCEECQGNREMSRCFHDFGEHEHIKFFRSKKKENGSD